MSGEPCDCECHPAVSGCGPCCSPIAVTVGAVVTIHDAGGLWVVDAGPVHENGTVMWWVRVLGDPGGGVGRIPVPERLLRVL